VREGKEREGVSIKVLAFDMVPYLFSSHLPARSFMCHTHPINYFPQPTHVHTHTLPKALITGPADTPYSFGCFEFDIFLPTNYPASPPSVKFLTTGGGTWRCNPNLYQVCLRLGLAYFPFPPLNTIVRLPFFAFLCLRIWCP